MQRLSNKLGFLAFSVLLLGAVADCYLAAPLDLGRHEGEANVICVGKVVAIDTVPTGEKPVTEATVEFRVDRVLKGDVEQGSTINIRYQHRLVNSPQILSGYDMVLLKRENGCYSFSRKFLSSMPASALPSDYRQSSDTLANLRWEVLHSLQDTDYQIVRAALEQASILPQEAVNGYVKRRISDPDIRIRSLALSTCITLGDTSVFREAFDLVKGELSKGEPRELAVMKLKVILEMSELPAKHLATVAKALRSPSPYLREFAAQLLRHSANKAALPYLKIALDDKDMQVRYNAILGFAEITKDYSCAPSMDRFKAGERQYIKYWKDKADTIK